MDQNVAKQKMIEWAEWFITTYSDPTMYRDPDAPAGPEYYEGCIFDIDKKNKEEAER